MNTQSNAQRKASEMYEKLFPDNDVKAAIFDKIAESYFMCNFGTVSKADMELLLFSEYLDRFLENEAADMQSFSDYNLSKHLGITQSRIKSLKEKKELKYPNLSLRWKEVFAGICSNARYDEGNIYINISDRSLYLEVKNAIEEGGGFVEVQLNTSLLKIPIEFFFDFLMKLDEENDVQQDLVKKIQQNFKQKRNQY